ncbi:GNAT family N-acetyltransferase [Natronoglycomyces albus]|uniref:GNAT family N-acetyltransferase n=1 Tax=Natronoglycomyces albus TaxID=2811108 RepID=A0A895XSL6_9ACTN|nr:GNAT family protein [Natronoglycomyces albus]QSB04628.1 GNAT family N-acetyltransferase [Natronoglycomyces albus]
MSPKTTALNTDIDPFPYSTERLILRRFGPPDADDVFSYRQLPEVAKYLYLIQPWTRETTAQDLSIQAKATFAADNDDLQLAVTRPEDPRVIGEVRLRIESIAAGQVEIGYIFHPEFQGRGYATEAATALLRLAFDTYGFHRAYARLDEENRGSVALCRRLGMRQEARLVENDIRDGVRGTELIFGMLASEWHSR